MSTQTPCAWVVMDMNMGVGAQCRNPGIKPRSLHGWAQYSYLIMQDELEKFKNFFRVFVETFEYICNIIGEQYASRFKNHCSQVYNYS